MRRLIAWLRRPYDRCTVGGHRMGTKAGYTMCRKHGNGSGYVSEGDLMAQAERDVLLAELAPTWAIVASTTTVFLALVLSLILQHWLTAIAWLAAFSQSIGWLVERADRRAGDDRDRRDG